MADMNDVRDELFRAASRVAGRQLTREEERALIDAYNAQDSGTIFDKCVVAIEEVLNVNLKVQILLEKSASVDRVRNALANLQAIATQAATKK